MFLHNALVQIATFNALQLAAARDGEKLLRDMLGRRDYHIARMAVADN